MWVPSLLSVVKFSVPVVPIFDISRCVKRSDAAASADFNSRKLRLTAELSIAGFYADFLSWGRH